VPFRNWASARAVRLGACVILAAMSAVVAEDIPALGLALFCVGFGGAIYQGVMLFRERPDRYDLSLLWEEPPAEPEANDGADRDLTYCHRCGASMNIQHAICPGCGGRVG